MRKILKLKLFFLFFIIASFQAVAFASVLVYDDITLAGEEITIKAKTTGRFFPIGGQIVEFFLEGKSLGKVLSGGDGFAFKLFTPGKYGLLEIVAKYGDDEDRGIIMSLRKGSQVVCIDVEGSLLSSPFSREPFEKSNESINNIMKKYPVIYLNTSFFGTKSVKELLKENKFPESVVLPWQTGNIFDDLNRKGIKVKAVIGSQQVIESADDLKPLAFSFEEFEGAENVKDWEEIEKRLK